MTRGGSRSTKGRPDVPLWWAQAAHDLESSEHNLAREGYDAAIFYCEQPVEKVLKAL